MATNFLTPNMGLVVPVVGSEPGPDWANDLNASLTILDQHTHAAGSGVLITPSAMNINADLSFNSSNNAIALRSVRFTPQSAALSGATDLGCLYEVSQDLYYNDGVGNQIRITQSGSVAGSSGTITGLPSGTASAAFDSTSGTFVFQQATSTGANLDVASIIVRYPGSYPSPSGNCIIIEAPTSLASQYSLTLPALPSQTNVMTLGTGGIISSITYDQVGVNMTNVGANAIATSVTRVVGATVPELGVAGAGPVTFSTTSTAFVSVGLTVTITTAGRPIFLRLASSGTTLGEINATGSCALQFVNATTVTAVEIFGFGQPGVTIQYPNSAFSALDFRAAGTYSYQVYVKIFGSGSVGMSNVILEAWEL